MADHPEMPFLAAGGISLIGGAIVEKGWPSNALKALIGTILLTVIASATGGTKIAPLVRAVGLLILLAASLATVKKVADSKKKK